MRSGKTLTLIFAVLLLSSSLIAQDLSHEQYNFDFLNRFKLEPPPEFRVKDTPNDNGGSLRLHWELSPDDNLWGKRGRVEKYMIGRRTSPDQEFDFITTATYHSNSGFDNAVSNKDTYEYVLAAYPFKSIFEPIQWDVEIASSQMDRLKKVSPWLSINPIGLGLSLIEDNYRYYDYLDGFESDLARKSIWENFSPASDISGPGGLAPSWAATQMISPLAPILRFAAESMVNSDPYQLVSMGQFLGRDMMATTEVAGPVKAKKSWFNMNRVYVFILAVLISTFILYFIRQARKGKELYIRKIAGLDAVEEAVGRATEMGKEIFYVPGTQDMENIQTIAGVTILGRVARLTAELETKLEVPVSRSLVMVTAREIVKEAYMNAGRPEAFHEDMVHYLTDDQFGYAAAIDGKMVRQRPATIFYMGAFYAESLILAETGNSIGAIQIAGTAMPAQLPFFVAACDYTLIGEELFAASAYLSREPKLLGSLKGQDIGKALLLVLLAAGAVIQTFGWFDFTQFFRV